MFVLTKAEIEKQLTLALQSRGLDGDLEAITPVFDWNYREPSEVTVTFPLPNQEAQ